ncbi:unnamed protein product [Auanema sp. JU1783]|nr:unnamed protein product [Auanema sp. JU1783]
MDLNFTDISDDDDIENSGPNYAKIIKEATVRKPLTQTNNILQNDRYGVDTFVFNSLVWGRIKPKEDVLLRPAYLNDPYEEYGDIVDSIPRLVAKPASPKVPEDELPSTMASRRDRILAMLTPVHESFKKTQTRRTDSETGSDIVEEEEEYEDEDEDEDQDQDYEYIHEEKLQSLVKKLNVSQNDNFTRKPRSERLKVNSKSTIDDERKKKRKIEFDDDQPLIFLLPEHKRKIYECRMPPTDTSVAENPESPDQYSEDEDPPRTSSRVLRERKPRFNLSILYEDSDAELEEPQVLSETETKTQSERLTRSSSRKKANESLVQTRKTNSSTPYPKSNTSRKRKADYTSDSSIEMSISKQSKFTSQDESDEDDDETLDFFIKRKKIKKRIYFSSESSSE